MQVGCTKYPSCDCNAFCSETNDPIFVDDDFFDDDDDEYYYDDYDDYDDGDDYDDRIPPFFDDDEEDLV